MMSQDCAIALQPGQKEQNYISKKTEFKPLKSLFPSPSDLDCL